MMSLEEAVGTALDERPIPLTPQGLEYLRLRCMELMGCEIIATFTIHKTPHGSVPAGRLTAKTFENERILFQQEHVVMG